MKRLLIVLATIVGVVAFAGAAAGAEGSPSIAVAVVPAAATVGDAVTATATLLDADGLPMVDESVTIEWGTNACDVDGVVLRDSTGSTSEVGTVTDSFTPDEPGVYSVIAYGDGYEPYDCVDLTVTAPVVPAIPSNEAASSYLCWNKEMVDPVAYVDKVADDMWKTGNYFEPQAILGHVEGGTNVGAYHLVCNMSGTLKETDQAIGGSGEVYDAAAVALYHQEHATGNDLNLYHIWK